jgi:hypothetical protein
MNMVLYGCETWSLTLREEQRLWEFENRVLRTIFGSKRDEVKEEGRLKPHNEELRGLCSSPSIIRMIESRRMRCVGHVERMWIRGTLLGYWLERGSQGRPRRRRAHNIKMDLGEIVWGGVDWFIWIRIRASGCECISEYSGSIKFRKTIEWLHS